MSMLPRRKLAVWLAGSITLLLLPLLVEAQPEPKGPDLTEYKTVETAATTKVKKGSATQIGSPGYLGVLVSIEGGKLVVSDVEANSPAAKVGLKSGDVLTSLDGRNVKDIDAFRSVLQSRAAGEKLE